MVKCISYRLVLLTLHIFIYILCQKVEITNAKTHSMAGDNCCQPYQHYYCAHEKIMVT